MSRCVKKGSAMMSARLGRHSDGQKCEETFVTPDNGETNDAIVKKITCTNAKKIENVCSLLNIVKTTAVSLQ